MTLPSSGPISMAMIANELGISASALSLNDPRVRNLAGRPSGPIGFSELRGKSAYTPMSGVGVDSEGVWPSNNGQAFTAIVYPQVSISGGAAPYTYSWSFTNSAGAALVNATSPYPSVTYRFGRFASPGTFVAVVQCLVTDSTGRTLLISSIYCTFEIV